MTALLYLLLFFSVLVFIYILERYGEKSIVYLIVFNVFYDVLGYLDDSVEATALIRAGITYFLFAYYFFKKGGKVKLVSLLPVIFIAYTTMIIILSGDISRTIRVHLRVITYFIFFVLMYDLYRTSNIKISDLLDKLPKVLSIYIIYTLFANIFNLGNLYKNRSGQDLINTGDIVGDFLLQISLAISLLPLYLYINNKIRKKWIYLILCSIALIFIFASGRRTAILVIIISYLVFLFFYKNKSAGLKYLALLLIFGGISVSIFINDIITRFESRNKGLSAEVIEQEARTREIPVAVDLVFSFDNPINSVFGKDMYADRGLVPNAGVLRPFHTDYARVLYGMGIIGFIIYFGFLFNILFKGWKLRNIKIPNDKDAILYSTLMMLIIFKLSVTYTGGLHVISYNALLFGTIGALMGYIKRQKSIISD